MTSNDIRDRMVGKRLWQILIGIGGAIFMVVLVLLSNYRITLVHKDLSKTADEKEKAVPVKVIRVVRENHMDTVILAARLEPIVESVVASEKAGVVVDLLTSKGSTVKAGQTLMLVDNRSWSNDLVRAKAVLVEAQNEYKRHERLLKTGAVSDTAFDAVTKVRDLALVALNMAGDDLQRCYVKSPFSGVLDDWYVEKGEYIQEGGAALKVVDISRVKLVLDIPERDVMCISEGDNVSFRLSAYPERSFKGEVSFVSVASDRGRNSFRAEVVVDNQNSVLRGGMIGNAVLKRKVRNNVIVLPLSAVVPLKGEHVVFAVKKRQARKCVVKIDSISDQHVLISSGIEEGSLIVVEGQRSLEDGLMVKIVK
ncbi:MAG: efflux RND transporter periplasmic adaptor subunit [Kiritimatiellae bacterium]|nr:efflux RND transporter periplasmic adaptor subunit [Kiritimatiellia bacterium]